MTKTASSTLLGTSGNDTLVIGSGITFVNGGAGTDTAVFSSPIDWYTITQTKSGIKVKNTHTGTTVTLTSVELLDFAGGTAINATGATLAQSNGLLSLTDTGGNNTVALGTEMSTVLLSGTNNTVVLGTGVDTVTLGSGNDLLKATAASLNTGDYLNGGTGINTLALTGGGTVNLPALAQFTNFQTVALDASGTTLGLTSAALTVTGTGGNNVITLGYGADVVTLGAGTNTVNLGTGVDTVTLGTGNDIVNATGASLNAGDHLDGGAGINTLALTGGGTVNLAALAQFANFQNIALDATGTTLTLTNAAETVTAAGGNNVVTLGTGVDTLSLGAGNNAVNATATSLNAGDHLNGGSGINTLALTGGGTVNLAALAQFANFQNIALDAAGTTLTLTNAAETVTAAGGNNVVTLGTGVDTLSLGTGNDTVFATAGSLNAGDHLDGGAGTNTLVVSGGGTINLAGLAQFTNFQAVVLDASGSTLTLSTDPVITAAGGNNVITLSNDASTVTLGAGNDTVTLGTGVDTVSLGDGNDILNATAASLNAGDHLDGGTGANVLALTGGGTVNLAGLAQFTNFQTVALDATGTTLSLTNDPTTVTAAGGNNVITLGNGVDTVTLGAGNDTVMVGAGAATGSSIDGGAGQNVAVFADAVTSYVIAPTTAGVDVTNSQTGAIVHLANIGTIDFAGGAVYDVATGQLTSSPSTITVSPGTLIGTSGNDTFTLDITSAPSTYVNGEGGNDTVVLTYGYSDWYHITENADGSVDLTEVHATGDTAHLVGIGTLDFAGGVQYDVATGQFSTITSSSGSGTTTTTSSSSTSSSVVTAPQLPQPNAAAGEVVAVELQNNTSQTETGHEVTFGQVFADGDMAAGSSLVATVNGQQIAAQMDVKTTYADGSVKEAIITLQEPTIAANGSVDVMLGHGTPIASGPAITAQSILANGYSEQVALNFHNADGTTTLQTIDVGNLLSQAIANNTVQTWMQGPLATQVRVTTAINAQMNATFDIQENADGTFVTGVTIANDVAYAAAATYTYDVTITDHGTVAFSQSNVTQYSYSDWHQNISSPGAAALPFVVHDVAYLEKTGAIANYDTSLGVTASEIASNAAAVAAGNSGILGNSLVTQYMPTTGGRPDIGPTTQWATEALISQDPTAAQTMYAQANVSGSVPWHFLDSATSEWVSVQNHPNLWIDSRGTVQNYGSDSLPTPYVPGGGWQPDVAHVPDLTYDAYLMTGSQYYLNELQAQASYDIAAFDPNYRGGAGGVFYGQVRAMAWGLRDVAEAASATPASDPLHAYFSTVVQNNLTSILNTLNSETGQFKGYLVDGYSNAIAPWQNEYMVVALGEAAQLGFSQAKDALGVMDNFITGLFLNGDNGYNPFNGPAYWLTYTDGTGAPLTTWSQLYTANFGTSVPTSIAGYPDSAGGYVANAKAALATLITEVGSVNDIQAYGYLVGQSPNMPASYQTDPAWNITPVLSDGHHLLNSEITVGPATGDVTMTAASADSLLYAGGGNDTLVGGSGVSLLFGGAGNDTLLSYAGNDYLFAGSGTTRLSAGAGNNYLKAGASQDTFVFNFTDAAHDTVVAFKPGTDILEIHMDGATATATSLISGATTDAAGDAVLHLGAGHDIILAGIHINQLSTSWFHMM